MDIATHKHLTPLRCKLLHRLGELRAEASNIRAQGSRGADAPEAQDFKDLAERQFLMHLDEVRELHEFTELQAVQAALIRLDADAYGDCMDCGEPIGLERLLRIPTAVRCLACQRSFERDCASSSFSANGQAGNRGYA